MRKMVINSINDLWMLSKCVAVIFYILMASILLCFDLEILKSVKGVVVPMYFALNFVLVCKYRKVLRKFKLYERILEESLSSGFFSNFRSKELCSLPKLYKSRVRSLSYPITSVEYRFFHSNWEHNAQNGLLIDNLYKLKSETRIAALNKSVGTSCKVYHKIPAKLHKCVNDLGSIIQRVKSLNLDYSRILEDTSVVNQNSEMIKNGNLKNKIPEDEEDIQHKLESTNCVNEISYNMKNPNMKTWSPLKDLDSVIQRIKSLNFDYIRNLEETSVVGQNSETVTKEILKNQIAKEEEYIQRKFETKKCTKEISCTAQSTAILPQAPHQVLDTKLSKNIKRDCIRNLGDTSVVNQNSETVTKEILKNQIAKEEEDIQRKLKTKKCIKEISCTAKSTTILSQAPHQVLDTKLSKNIKRDCIRNLGDTSVVDQNSETVTKEILKNQIAREEEYIQRKLETKKCTKEISCTAKSTAILPQAPHQVSDTKLSKNIKRDCTRNLEFTSNENRKLQALIQKNKKNQISKAVEEKKHKYICPRHAKLLSSTVKKTYIIPRVSRRNLGTEDKLTKNIALAPKNTPAHCLLASMLEYEGTYEASLSTAKKFIRNIIFIKLNTYVDYLIKIPLNKQDYNRLNNISNIYLERMEVIFYKTIAPIRHNSKAVISLKKHVPQIPMRPYLRNVSFTPHMQQLSRKRYINSISIRESNIKNITQKFQRMFTGTRRFCQLYKLKDMCFGE